jgi:hypothetical protein
MLAAVAATAPASAAEDSPFTNESKLDSAQAGFHRIKIGRIVTAISDGSGGFFVLNVVAKRKRTEAEKLMAKSWVKQPVDASVNAFLIKLPAIRFSWMPVRVICSDRSWARFRTVCVPPVGTLKTSPPSWSRVNAPSMACCSALIGGWSQK